MNRILAVLVVLPLMVHAQTRPANVFISVDMEGITGVGQVLTSLEAP